MNTEVEGFSKEMVEFLIKVMPPYAYASAN
jgi:hypothetical protein